MSLGTVFRRLLPRFGKKHALGPSLDELCAARPGIGKYLSLEKKARAPRLSLRPPASLHLIEDFERESGITLPDDYVFYLTCIGNGGIAPCRLQSLDDWNAAHWAATKLERDLIAPCLITPELEALGDKWLDALGVADASAKWDRDEWDPMRGTIAVADFGCGLYYRMIANGPHRGRVFLWGDRATAAPSFEPQPNFASWLGFHLDLAAEGKPVHFLNGRIR